MIRYCQVEQGRGASSGLFNSGMDKNRVSLTVDGCAFKHVVPHRASGAFGRDEDGG